MGSAVSEYFERKGAIRIFCRIDSSGKRFSEIEKATDVSTDTLTKRLKEAVALDLLDHRSEQQEDGEMVPLYQLTLHGLQIRKAIIELQLDVIYADLFRDEELFQGHSELFRSWIEDEFERGSVADQPSLDEHVPDPPEIDIVDDITSSEMGEDN